MSADEDAHNGSPDDFFWQTYLDASRAEDETRPKNWEGSTTGILTFTGLFAATVAAFIVESYKLLSPDSGERTNILLEQLFVAMGNVSSQNPIVVPSPQSFSVQPSAIVTNVLWFLSLLIALVCALLSTLVQEWSRNYVQDINRRKVLNESLRDRAFNHIYIRMGVNRYGMDQFVSWIVALVHLTVILFAGGLLVFLFPISLTVAAASTGVLGAFLVIYSIASLMPLLDRSCPYRTPVSYMMAFIYWLALRGWNTYSRLWLRSRQTMAIGHFPYIVTRQYTGKYTHFLTDSRSMFAWECVHPHINSATEGIFLKCLPYFIRLHGRREAVLSRMCFDEHLLDKLRWISIGALTAMYTQPSSPCIDAEIFELMALLSERVHALEIEYYSASLGKVHLGHPLRIVRDMIGVVSYMENVEGIPQLSASLCLGRVRCSLLELCLKAFGHEMPNLTETEVSRLSQEGFQLYYRLGDCNPSALLLLIISGTYHGSKEGWKLTGASALLPLHREDCCRDWKNTLTAEGLAHAAPCIALTTVSHILRSNDGQRSHACSLLSQVLDFLEDWVLAYPNPRDVKREMPSPAYVSVLRLAGLDDWLEPESTFETGPRDGPNRKFLNDYPGYRCVVILRELARHVDFAAYRELRSVETAIPSSSPLQDDAPTATSIPPSLVTNTLALPQSPSSSGANDEIERYNVPGSAWPGPRMSSLPITEASLAAEDVQKDVHGTSGKGVTTDRGSPSDPDAPVLTRLGAERGGYGHDGAPGSRAGELSEMAVDEDREPSARTDHNQASDVTNAGRMSPHREHAPDANEDERTTTSPPLEFDGREHEQTLPPESSVLKSIRVDGDHGAEGGTADDVRGTATVPGLPPYA